MALPNIGDTVTIKSSLGERRGKVVMYNLEHRWFMVEFKCEYRDYYSGKRSSYRECFKYNPENQRLSAIQTRYPGGRHTPRGFYTFASR